MQTNLSKIILTLLSVHICPLSLHKSYIFTVFRTETTVTYSNKKPWQQVYM